MKILLICDFFDESLDYQENILVKYYLKHGHDVVVLTSVYENIFDFVNGKYDRSAKGRTYQFGRAKIIKTPFRYNILNKLRALKGVAGYLEAEAPDMILMNDIMPNIPEVVAYKKKNPACRFVMDYHADYSNSANNWLSLKVLHGVIRKGFLRHALPHLDRIFPVTPASIKFLEEVYDVSGPIVELLPLGADMDLGLAAKERGDGVELRRRLGIGEQDIVIFTGGKFAPLKQTELAIQAVLALPHLPLQLVVVGSAPQGLEEYEAGLRQLAAGHDHIRFTGWLDKEAIYCHLAMADLAVFPQSQSILWVQSVAMGLPLIAGDLGDQDPSYMNLHDNIVVLPRGEINASRIAQEIERVAGDPARLAAMRAGAERVSSEFLDWNKLIERTILSGARTQAG